MNTRKLLGLLFLFFYTIGMSQNFFKYKVSKPYCLLNFIQTASGSQGISDTFKDFIDKNSLNNSEFKQIIEEYKNLNLYYSSIKEDYPESRKYGLSTFDLIGRSAIISSDLDQMKTNCLGFIPLETNQKLIAILKKTESFYDKMVWLEHQSKIDVQLKSFEKFEKINSCFFIQINSFYDASWTTDVPFEVALYPMPGKEGHSTATAYINTLCVGNFVEDNDFEGSNGIVLHEMCHILYKEQNKTTQFLIEDTFNKSTSKYAKYAYSYFDEALATAIGNGWAFKKMKGNLDKNDWYAQSTINGFAKAIYPIVEEYIENKKSIDAEFVNKSISLFEKTFPNSIYDYSIALNNVEVYTGNFKEMELVNQMSEYFQIYGLNLFSSTFDEKSIENFVKSKNTQFYIFDSEQNQNLVKLKKYFTQLKLFKFQNKNQTFTFRDNGRVVIVMLLKNKSDFKTELEKMNKQKVFDSKNPLQIN